MKILEIKNKQVLLDDEDFDWIKDLSWRPIGTDKNYFAKSGRYMNQVIYLHRLIMIAEYGHDVIGFDVDHIDRNPLNCQKNNMRLVTEQQNAWNRKHPNKIKSLYGSKYKGVRRVIQKYKNKPLHVSDSWAAYIQNKYIGAAKTEIEAAKIYNKKAKELYGEFAILNII